MCGSCPPSISRSPVSFVADFLKSASSYQEHATRIFSVNFKLFICMLCVVCLLEGGWASSVCRVTTLRDGRSGDRIRWGGGRYFLCPSRPALKPLTASCTMDNASFPGIKRSEGDADLHYLLTQDCEWVGAVPPASPLCLYGRRVG